MKHALTTLAIALLLVQPTSARIGENRKEVVARYGNGEKFRDRLTAAGAETFRYEKSGFIIDVVFLDGKSVMEVIHRKDKTITDDDIKDLLKLYDSPSTNWRFDRKEKRWERGGKPKLVAFREPGHDDFFFIKDIEACDAVEKKTKEGIKSL
jgi:hypothetical protein